MKVLFSLFSGIYPNSIGGMEIFNYYLIKELSGRGLNVHYTSVTPLNYEGPIYHHVFNLRPQKFFWPIQDFFVLLFRKEITTYVISYSEANWLIWKLFTIITKLLKLKLIIVIHHGKSVPSDHYSVYHNFFSCASNVVAVSSDIKANYDREYGINCQLIYPLLPYKLCDEDELCIKVRYNIPRESFIISMVGTIKRMKNPDTLIKAFSCLGNQYLQSHKLKALYVGSGDMMDELHSLVNDLNLAEFVVFLGTIPKDDINKVMAISNIYLIASDYEGTSTSLLEAMYNKVPIIISRAPGLITMLNENIEALAFQTKNENELAQCIKYTVENKELAKNRAVCAYKKYLELYNYNSVIRDYLRIFGYEQ